MTDYLSFQSAALYGIEPTVGLVSRAGTLPTSRTGNVVPSHFKISNEFAGSMAKNDVRCCLDFFHHFRSGFS